MKVANRLDINKAVIVLAALFALLFLCSSFSAGRKHESTLSGRDFKFVWLSYNEIRDKGIVFFDHDREKIEEFKRLANETDINDFDIKNADDYLLYLKLRDWNSCSEDEFWNKYLESLDKYSITVSYSDEKVKVDFMPLNMNQCGGDFHFVFDMDGNLLEEKFGA